MVEERDEVKPVVVSRFRRWETPGEEVTGWFLARQEVETSMGLATRWVMEVENVGAISWLGTRSLDATLPAHVGHRVRIRYDGMQRTRAGRTVKTFTVACYTCAAPDRYPPLSEADIAAKLTIFGQLPPEE